MASLVQTTVFRSAAGATSHSVPFGVNVKPGNRLVIMGASGSGFGTPASMTAAITGNTVTKILDTAGVFGVTRTNVWTVKNALGGAATINFTLASSAILSVVAQEWEGIDRTDNFDVIASTTATTMAPTITSASTNYDDELVVGLMSSLNNSVITPDVSYSNSNITSGGSPTLQSASKIVGAIGAQTYSTTVAVNSNGSIAVVTFRLAQEVELPLLASTATLFPPVVAIEQLLIIPAIASTLALYPPTVQPIQILTLPFILSNLIMFPPRVLVTPASATVYSSSAKPLTGWSVPPKPLTNYATIGKPLTAFGVAIKNLTPYSVLPKTLTNYLKLLKTTTVYSQITKAITAYAEILKNPTAYAKPAKLQSAYSAPDRPKTVYYTLPKPVTNYNLPN